MKPNYYPYIPKHIVLRRYEQVNIYDLKNDESYIVDDEAYSVLNLINGTNSNDRIIDNYQGNKKKEVSEALNDFYELNIIDFSDTEVIDKSNILFEHIDLPRKNPFAPPFLKNLMINITEKCNLKCKHCYITNKNPINFPLEKLIKIITEFYNLQGIRLILTGGEPFLYSKLKDLLIFRVIAVKRYLMM